MKRVLIMFIMLVTAFVLVGCDGEENNQGISNNLLSNEILLLENEYNNENIINLEFTLEDKITALKEKRKNFYLIDYIQKEKYYCGYIPENVKKQVDEKIWVIGDNILNSFKNFISNNEIDFKFDDIKWIEYDNINDVSCNLGNENYMLQFIYKINEVIFIEDINDNMINKTVLEFIFINFSIQEDKLILSDFEELDEGKYLLYGIKLDNFENINFNKFILGSMNNDKKYMYILQKISENNLIYDFIEYNQNDVELNLFELKYGTYKNKFETIIEKKENINKNTLGYWNFEEYKKIIIEIINQ